ncbi:hypothetical protein AMTRI_Chr09g37000 [Amborella trichopoda]|uniref:Uncharacterized protein n=1 Tax=Amborella trichopoda TaxID=13333 RepID=W1NM80_AMBTC|nr:uncharacterized protein LOC110006388 [Amborella trichopoda]ERM96621.1 hypothetical protein AMTR_s00001p00271830 [Amborella trichopoda]|eukprot:XP_020517331.1 uncharacterized protein LOC110006388 [Amborella trichopoda]
MSSMSKLGLSLTIVSILIFLALIVEFFYLLYQYRNTNKNTTLSLNEACTPNNNNDPEPIVAGRLREQLSDSGQKHFLATEVDFSLPAPPRFLFTIKEESESEEGGRGGKSRKSSLSFGCLNYISGEDESPSSSTFTATPYMTPCSSPQFPTPAFPLCSSPQFSTPPATPENLPQDLRITRVGWPEMFGRR